MRLTTSVILCALSLILCPSGHAQHARAAAAPSPSSNNSSSPLILQDTEPFPDPSGQEDTPLSVRAREERLRIEDRQKHLAADTARLVQLSNELQASVARGGKNLLSLEDLRHTEEIEKLARKIRDRLKS